MSLVQDLERKRVLFESVTAATDVMLVYLDRQMNFVWVNQAYADTCQMTPNEMVGKNHFELYPDAENEAIFRKVRDTGESVFYKDKPFEFPDQPERGITYWDWSLSPVKAPDNLVTGLVFSLRETTSFVRAQQALHAREEEYRRLFEYMAEGFALHEIILDPDGTPVDYRYLNVNPAFEKLTGLKHAEIIGHRVREVIPEVEPFWIDRYGAVAATGTPVRFEEYAGALARWYDVSAYSPAPGQFAVLINDITQRKEHEQALQEAKNQAVRAVEAKNRFLAAASHDLRQPMTALSMYAGVLDKKLPPGDYKLAKDIQNCVESLSLLLTDMLDLSKLEAGAVKPNVLDFPVAELFGKMLSEHMPEAQLKGLKLRFRQTAEMAHTDPALLYRIASNLVSNAIRYTDMGGILVGCRRRKNSLRIEVWDTGIGIPSDKTGEIFEEFKQLGDASRNRGTGLGLSIAAKTAALLGGKIQVRSQPGRGSVFAVELPVGGELVSEKESKRQADGDVQKLIALVEDNQVLLDAFTYAFQTASHTVIAGTSGPELITKLDSSRPDIIISDYRLAGNETGYGVINLVRSMYGQDIPALIITGDTDPAIIRSMIDKGITIMHKPFEFHDLLACVETLKPKEIA